MHYRSLFCAIAISSFSLVALTTPAKAADTQELNPAPQSANEIAGSFQLANWWWDGDDRYGFDRCQCDAWKRRALRDCDDVCEKYRAACIAYKTRKSNCNCGPYYDN